jgi:GNAT superfamily N-acetyltransferase
MLLDNVAVERAAQGRGHGRRLMAWAEDRAREQGLPKMRLYTHEKMASNIARYTRAGYRETERVTERGLNRVYMEKPLGRRDP